MDDALRLAEGEIVSSTASPTDPQRDRPQTAVRIPALPQVDILPSFRGRPGGNIDFPSRPLRTDRRVRLGPAPRSRRLPICQSLIAAP